MDAPKPFTSFLSKPPDWAGPPAMESCARAAASLLDAANALASCSSSLASRFSASCVSYSAVLRDLAQEVGPGTRDGVVDLRAGCAARVKALDSQAEACDVSGKQLEALALLCEHALAGVGWMGDLAALSQAADALLPLAARFDGPCVSTFADILSVDTITEEILLRKGVAEEGINVSGRGLARFAHGPNLVTVECVDEWGLPLASLCPHDLTIHVTHGVVEVLEAPMSGTLAARYTVPDEGIHSVSVSVSVLGRLLSGSPWPVPEACEVAGVHMRTLPLQDPGPHRKLAIDAAGAHMLIASQETCVVHVHALPSGTFLHKFGGQGVEPGMFNRLADMCCTPAGTVLAAEDRNDRVQELDLTGGHIRFIPVEGAASCIACDSVHIAVLVSNELYLYSYASGDRKRRLKELLCMDRPFPCMLFSLDGSRVLACNQPSKHVVSWNLEGREGPTSCTLAWPSSMALTQDGALVVTEYYAGCVTVTRLPSDGEPLRRIMSRPGVAMTRPISVVISNRFMYTLGEKSSCVHVFA